MTSDSALTRKPRARRGGRKAVPRRDGRDKGLVCQHIVDHASRGQGVCGQVLSNQKQANIHLGRQHGLTGQAKSKELASMHSPCPFRGEDGAPSTERDHAWKLMPEGETWLRWCLACGAFGELTQAESGPLDQQFDDDYDSAVQTPRLKLGNGGRAKWDAAIVQRATRLRIDAERGSLDVSRQIDVRAVQYKVLRYQMRELVNFRQVKYDREKQTVTWTAYDKTWGGPRETKFSILDFKAGLAEYQWRLKQWPQGKDEGMEIHRAYGHIAKRSVRKTQKAMGGVPLLHDEECPCAECGDWERVFLDDFDAQAGLVRSLNDLE